MEAECSSQRLDGRRTDPCQRQATTAGIRRPASSSRERASLLLIDSDSSAQFLAMPHYVADAQCSRMRQCQCAICLNSIRVCNRAILTYRQKYGIEITV